MPPLAETPVRVWDLPTRLCHWLLAAAVTGAVLSAKAGAMEWHFRLGLLIVGLLVFRVLWGLFGGRWSRFASFVYAPATLWLYLRGQARADAHLHVGHTPTGALAVFAFIALLALQVGTGLVADDEVASVGPLNRFVGGDAAASATSWHRGWGQWLLLGLIALHVVAIVAYALRGSNLVTPMIGGDKVLPAGTPASADGLPQRLWALLLALVSAALVAWIVTLSE
jgi:cytochrome b